jgi:5-formyltetrahydrofolate cyclo-ligase
MQTSNTLQEQKTEIRTRLKQIRAGMPASLRKAHSKLIHGHLAGLDEVIFANSVFIYVSFASEVDTHAVIRQFLEEGKSLAVPKIVDADHMISVHFTSWEDLSPDVMEILTPTSSTPDSGPFDIAITPGVGFTLAGGRLGFGRGYYDKWLSANTAKTRIALAFEAQLVDSLPTGTDDIPVDIIVTEKRVIRVIKSND